MKKLFIFMLIVIFGVSGVSAVNVPITDDQARNLLLGDSWVYQDSPNSNYGTDDDLYIQARTSIAMRSYVNFDLDRESINAEDVANATLNMYQHTSSSATSYDIEFYYCSSDFAESTITWNNQGTQVTGCDVSPFGTYVMNEGNGWKTFDITDEIQSNSEQSFTIKIVVNPEQVGSTTRNVRLSSSEYTTTSLRPRLNIETFGTPEITNNQTNNSYLNYQPSILLNTESNVNMSVIFNGASESSICNECNTSTYNPTLIEGVNTFNFISNSILGEVNSSLTLNYDTITPTITNNLPNEINLFTLSDSLFSCEDANIDTCRISINSQTADFDQIIDLTDSGDLSYTITATDLAGNTIQEQGTLLVNPYAFFYFEEPDTTPIESFTLNGENHTNYAQIKYYNDSLTIGENTLQFESNGFAITDIFFNLSSNTPNLNQTFTIQNSKIVLKIYDFETGNLMNTNVDISLIETSYQETLPHGEINISEISFYDGEYQLIMESSNHETQILYFNYNNKEVLELNAYLIATNAANLGVLNVKAETTTNSIEGQIVNLLSWDSNSSAYITVGQSKTDSNGDAFFDVLLGNKVYKVNAVRNGVIKEAPEQIISLSGTTIYLFFGDNLEDYQTYNLNGLTYSLVNTSHNVTHDLVTFTFSDNNNLVANACLEVNRVRGSYQTQLSENCISSSAGQIQIYTKKENEFNKEVLASVLIESKKYKLTSIDYNTGLTLENGLGSLAKWIALALMIATIALGVYIENINLTGIGTIVAVWTIYSIFSNTISYTIPLLITLVMILVLYGTFKKRF